MATELEALVEKLQPQYVGYLDQYKAVMYALGVNPDANAGTCAMRYTQSISLIGQMAGMMKDLVIWIGENAFEDSPSIVAQIERVQAQVIATLEDL
jgi:hypothetical protein